jgi:hypothetical protein
VRKLAYLLGILALAACARTLPVTPPTGSPAFGDDAVPSKKTGPTYSLAIVLPAATRPSGTAAVESLKVISLVGKREYHDIAEAPLGARCSVGSSGLSGCEILAGTSVTLKKGTFTLYSKAKAMGCAIAAGTYAGALVVNGAVPVKFKLSKKC